MKVLTLRQPWATLVALGAKKIETRSWSTSYRGPLAIHAAKRFTREQIELCERQPFIDALHDYARGRIVIPDRFPVGAIVATSELRSVVEIAEDFVVAEPEMSFGDFAPGRFAWLLYNVQPVDPPILARGFQRLWEMSYDI